MINQIYYLKTCKINNGYICNDSFSFNFIQQLEEKKNLIFSLTTHQIQGMNKTSLQIEKWKIK